MVAPIRNFEKREHFRRDLDEQPPQNRISDGDFVNVAPLQLSEEVLWIHSARLDEALVTGRTLR